MCLLLPFSFRSEYWWDLGIDKNLYKVLWSLTLKGNTWIVSYLLMKSVWSKRGGKKLKINSWQTMFSNSFWSNFLRIKRPRCSRNVKPRNRPKHGKKVNATLDVSRVNKCNILSICIQCHTNEEKSIGRCVACVSRSFIWALRILYPSLQNIQSFNIPFKLCG